MANLYDLKKFDLNLLVIFECIYQHLSISKAAETLFITPSAVSQSLQRLRNQLNDPLFIRSGKGISPTTVGVNLHKHLEQNLNQIEQTINIMHGSALKKNFVIYCPQVLTQNRMIGSMKLLMREHNYEVEFHDMLLSVDSAEDLLAYRKADLVFSFASVSNRSIVCSHFIHLPMVIVCREAHPRIGDAATLEELSNEKYTLFMSEEPGVKSFQAQAESAFPERKIAFRCDSFFSLITMISSSNLLGFVPEAVYEKYRDAFKLKKIDAPVTLPAADVYMMYNRTALTSTVFSNFIEQISNEDFQYD
ncbi:MAG: LysR family transcriptional regulator [Leclercia adecarboxylata]|uniref:LysR family transcriptional regulator n=1 Tax=Leclercia adecarboxylata TaxID=83655 RepID=A0AAP9DBY3_9ENTR|nr:MULTISPECIES: LysR substrate-binding domain-containing protein [Leclercia]MDU1060732.1 LysR family transcriptional regulator [Leclercia adecarboxylata]QDK19680.1 LysR family transcriptional regulator [Leclercia adecarboxylata]QGU14306.1 LysR family transcriptional regulator [Leclercia sp. 119287]